MAGGLKKKGRELAILCWFGWGFGRNPSYAEYASLCLCRGVLESRRAWEHATGVSLTGANARPGVGFFLGLQDEEDADEAAMEAAQFASNAMMQKALEQKGAA